MVKNLASSPISAPLAHIGAPKNFFINFTSTGSYHCMQFQGKINNQTWENGRKLSFGLKLWFKFDL